ncbi:unnamed protein product [Paramecium octaurelia]|uniref:Uncharacterized protein n=1 Tax=Paramecium octaurelia TaxID=43137 RepID=A0A8S1VZE7_PAROT|nr:unnamed protein product [Paramecium octaurelia]
MNCFLNIILIEDIRNTKLAHKEISTKSQKSTESLPKV